MTGNNKTNLYALAQPVIADITGANSGNRNPLGVKSQGVFCLVWGKEIDGPGQQTGKTAPRLGLYVRCKPESATAQWLHNLSHFDEKPRRGENGQMAVSKTLPHTIRLPFTLPAVLV